MTNPTEPDTDPASAILNATEAEEYVASPCISVCSVDAVTKMCIGCLRTLQEIGAWRTMTPTEKKACVARTEERALATPRRSASGQPFAPDHPKLKRFRK
ncbi:MAG: DUF1289 domain-containing protein [Rhodospirillaceae bacterium]|nr:DUF1289 domain-containing protein [Rhodospirillaceae bacterium]